MRIFRDSVTLDNGVKVPLARGKYDKINRKYIVFFVNKTVKDTKSTLNSEYLEFSQIVIKK